MYVVIIAQKNHHTKFSSQGATDVVPPGTIIDNRVCRPKEQWRLSLCTVNVCLHRRTMISILVMYVLTVDVCLNRGTMISILVMSVFKIQMSVFAVESGIMIQYLFP